jgi:hypothetical protein
MARSNFSDEIKSSMSNPTPPSAGKKPAFKTVTEKEPTDPKAARAEDIQEAQAAGLKLAPGQAGVGGGQRMPPNAAPPRLAQQAPPDPHHAQLAAGIAHAILNRGAGGGGM